MSGNKILFLAVFLSCLITITKTEAQKLYWTDTDQFSGSIDRMNVDGTQFEHVIRKANLWKIELDRRNKHLYWLDGDGIQRINIDGSNLTTILSSSDINSFALDTADSKLLWIDRSQRTINRSSLNGANKEVLLKGLINPQFLALDTQKRNMYWFENNYSSNGSVSTFFYKLYRADLDGSNGEIVVTLEYRSIPWDIKIDPVHEKIYYAEDGWDGRVINRMDMDGSNKEIIIDLSGYISEYFTLDLNREKIYWHSGGLWRSNLDGSDIEMLQDDEPVINLGNFVVDSKTNRIYWIALSHYSWDTLYRRVLTTNLDGIIVKEIIFLPMIFPGQIAVDPMKGKMYWTNSRFGKMQRANLNGSNMEDIFLESTANISALAVHPYLEKIYWIDANQHKIKRSNLDGTEMELLIDTGENMPSGLFLHLPQSKIYWTEDGDAKIRRADLDGTNIEDVLIDPDIRATQLTIDTNTDVMYWTDVSHGKIQRAPITGEWIEEVATGYSFLYSIAFDDVNQKIYWRDLTNIYRANTDGTDVELFISRLRHLLPYYAGIALDLREPLGVRLDIKPGSWPNKINPKSRGKINTAIAGSDELNVADIDLDSIRLRRADGEGEAVRPWAAKKGTFALIEDVTSSFDDSGCDHPYSESDGFDDLSLKFSIEEMVKAFGLRKTQPRGEIELTIGGDLSNGLSFTATDCIMLVGQR